MRSDVICDYCTEESCMGMEVCNPASIEDFQGKDVIDVKEAKKLTFDYDSEAGVMYASAGKPKKAISIEASVVLRFDPKTQELCGFTVLDWKEAMKQLFKKD